MKTLEEPTIAEVHALSHEGRGIATVLGKTVFIDGALPAETVKFEYIKRRRRFDEGRITEILKASLDRVVPPCQHFNICGGCSLQHMDPLAQVQFKQNTVLEQLRHFGGVVPQHILPPMIGPVVGYRRRARVGVKFVNKKGKLLIGFREKRNSFLADLERCEVLHPAIGTLFPELKTLISGLEACRTIPQLEVAIGDQTSALVFRHLEALSTMDQQSLIAFGSTHNIHIYLQPEGPASVHKIWPIVSTKGEDELDEHKLWYRLPNFGVEIQFQPTDFTQVNAEINQKMVTKVIELLELKPTDRVLDLFCGLGNFTLPMATRAAQVIGVEGSELAVKRAFENANRNGINNVEFYAENLQKNTFEAPWAFSAYDKILLDPPRTGAIELIPLISKSSIIRLVYVSCNPATLARDVGELVKNYGFKLESIGILDMFPHTTHVESIAVLQREKA